MPPGVLMSAVLCTSLTLETCLIPPTKTHRMQHVRIETGPRHQHIPTITHTSLNVNTHIFVHWLSCKGVYLDTEHLTLTEWSHHKTDRTKSCCVTSQRQGAEPVLFVSCRQCRNEQTGNRRQNMNNKTHLNQERIKNKMHSHSTKYKDIKHRQTKAYTGRRQN